MLKDRDKLKITCAAIFIATYTTLILNLSKIIDPHTKSVLLACVYSAFVIWGSLIDILFFFFITLTAVELTENEKKTISLDIETDIAHIKKIKEKLFSYGIRLVAYSLIEMPIVIIPLYLHLSFGVSGLYTILILIFLQILYLIVMKAVFSSKKKTKSL